MRKFLAVACLSLVATLSLSSLSQAAIPATGNLTDDIVTLIYDPADGNFSIDTAGKSVTTLEIVSASGVFTGTKPGQVLPPFDVYTPGKFFLLKTAGMGNENFGPAVAPGLAASLANDLSVTGSLAPSGPIGTVDLMIVPEPSSLALIGLGLLGVAKLRRNRA